MARQILFRGKDFLTGEWVFGSLVNFADEAFIAPQSGDRFGLTQVDFATVGQFIGRFDNARNRVFEGDLFKSEVLCRDPENRWGGTYWVPVVSEICFVSPSFVGRILKQQLVVSGRKFDFDGTTVTELPNEIAVIGNLYDNPEFEKKGAYQNEKD